MDNTEITVYGTNWCLDSRRARRFLDAHQIKYIWINIDQDIQAEQFVLELNKGMRSVPTIIFPDGSSLVEPSTKTLEEKFITLTNQTS